VGPVHLRLVLTASGYKLVATEDNKAAIRGIKVSVNTPEVLYRRAYRPKGGVRGHRRWGSGNGAPWRKGLPLQEALAYACGTA
jgi:hypothetical protein